LGKSKSGRYLLTYLGPSDVLDDSAVSGLVWQRGETHEVDEATRRRFVPDAPAAVPSDPRFVTVAEPQPERSPWLAMWRAEPVREPDVPIKSLEVSEDGNRTI
jgi:hypothetical protein